MDFERAKKEPSYRDKLIRYSEVSIFLGISALVATMLFGGVVWQLAAILAVAILFMSAVVQEGPGEVLKRLINSYRTGFNHIMRISA